MGFLGLFFLFCLALAIKGFFQSEQAKQRGRTELWIALTIVLISVIAFLLSGSFHP